MKVLVVEDEPNMQDYVAKVAAGLGYEVRCASDGHEGLAAFRDFAPDLVLADIFMPEKSGLEMLEDLRREDSQTIVIILTGYGSEEHAVQALRLRANDYIKKPIRAEELRALLRKYAGIVNSRHLLRQIPGLMLKRSFSIKFENRIELIPEVADFLIGETGAALSDEDRLGIHLGLNELLMNAVEHGNLAIGAEDKSKAMSKGHNGLAAIYEQRLNDDRYRSRQVAVDFTMDDEKCEWVITDEGDGFDWSGLKDPTKGEALASLTGRGIFLSRFQFDDLEYLGNGNKVRVRKFIKKA